MASYKLTEIAVAMIETHIKTNIAAALAEVRTDRADARVTTEVPKSYFKFPRARGYDSPAVFTIAEGFDFRHGEGWNYIYGTHDIKVAVLVEDKDMYNLTTKAWRYQAALVKVLNETVLQDSAMNVKLVVKILRNAFGAIFSEAADTENPMAVFHKEVICELEVEHYEQL